MAANDEKRAPLLVLPEQGRSYAMGPMSAIFKADREETAGRYSISEWWLDPQTWGPGEHAHDEDHLFYVIEGTLMLAIDGRWSSLARGSYAIIPGGTPHDFANHGALRTGFISINAPGGFETRMPAIAEALSAEDLRLPPDARGRA